MKERLDRAKRVMAFELLESQRMALYMYTSCGWFFDDISGLEATQVLMYADRAMSLVRKWARSALEDKFLSIMSRAKSNDPAVGDGAAVFEKRVKQARMSPGKVGANYISARMLHGKHGPVKFFEKRIQTVEEEQYTDHGTGEMIGEIFVSDPMTGKSTGISFSAVGSGPVDFECRAAEEGQSSRAYTFADLAPDTQRDLMRGISRSIFDHVTQQVEKEEERLLLCLRYPVGEKMEPLPGGVKDVLRLDVRMRLLRLMGDPEKVSSENAVLREMIQKATAWEYPLQVDDLEIRNIGRKVVNALMEQIAEGAKIILMTALMEFLDVADTVSLKLDLWECQNRYRDLSIDGHFIEPLSSEQVEAFKKLGKRLGFIT